MRSVRVMVVDNHEIVRHGLQVMMKRHPTLQMVGEAESVSTALAEAARVRPDVIVMDVRLSDGSGIEACRAIRARQPEVRVLMLTSYEDEAAVRASAQAGASGFLLKGVRARDLAQAIEAVARGESLDKTGTFRGRTAPGLSVASGVAADRLVTLTEKQRRILELVAEGKTNHEIAETVALSEKTVKNGVSVVLRKLGMTRRSQIAAYMATRRAWASGETNG
jgi:two-component system response regulator DevR